MSHNNIWNGLLIWQDFTAIFERLTKALGNLEPDGKREAKIKIAGRAYVLLYQKNLQWEESSVYGFWSTLNPKEMRLH